MGTPLLAWAGFRPEFGNWGWAQKAQLLGGGQEVFLIARAQLGGGLGGLRNRERLHLLHFQDGQVPGGLSLRHLLHVGLATIAIGRIRNLLPDPAGQYLVPKVEAPSRCGQAHTTAGQEQAPQEKDTRQNFPLQAVIW